ncbi:MAG: hypothetical protein HYZ34_15240 [Ignavibacteriae bacterium]|nr:hypothetical protein [Ignavibacteriota bacterium]
MEKLKVKGWTIYLNNYDGKWHAAKRITNSLHTVYIGKDATKAVDKIMEYCDKKGIALEESKQISSETNDGITNRVSELETKVKELEEQVKEQQREIAQLKTLLGNSLATKPKSITARKPKETNTVEKEETDWDALRKMVKQEARQRGGNQPLARAIGVSESIIRRFVKGESKTLSQENLAKVKQAVK